MKTSLRDQILADKKEVQRLVMWASIFTWVVNAILLTVALFLSLPVFAHLNPPLWLLAISSVIFALCCNLVPRYLFYTSLITIFVALIVKFGGAH